MSFQLDIRTRANIGMRAMKPSTGKPQSETKLGNDKAKMMIPEKSNRASNPRGVSFLPPIPCSFNVPDPLNVCVRCFSLSDLLQTIYEAARQYA